MSALTPAGAGAEGFLPPGLAAVVFSAVDIEASTAFVSAGGKLSLPMGEGWRAFALAAGGLSLGDMRRARDGKIGLFDIAADFRMFAGAEKSFGAVFASLGAGPSVAQIVGRRGFGVVRGGLAVHADIWFRPTDTLYGAWTTIADSAQKSLWTRLRLGWRPPGMPFFIGPEASANRGETSRKWRAGLHLSEWKIGPLTLSVSGGWQRERRRNAPYGTVTTYVTF